MNLVELITNPETVKTMFGGELHLDSVKVSSLLLSGGPNLRVGIEKSTLPEVIPLKWAQQGFNALSCTLNFVGIKTISINHWEPMWRCDPQITSSNDMIRLEIKNSDHHILCVSEFLTLRDIRGYVSRK